MNKLKQIEIARFETLAIKPILILIVIGLSAIIPVSANAASSSTVDTRSTRSCEGNYRSISSLTVPDNTLFSTPAVSGATITAKMPVTDANGRAVDYWVASYSYWHSGEYPDYGTQTVSIHIPAGSTASFTVGIECNEGIVGYLNPIKYGTMDVSISNGKQYSFKSDMSSSTSSTTSPAFRWHIDSAPVLKNTPPDIKNANDVTVEAGSVFDPLDGVTATDVEDGDLTSKITVDGKVNSNVPGSYTLNYKVTDSDGQTTSADRIITVVDTTAPTITGVTAKTIAYGSIFDPLAGVAATDIVDGTVTVKVASGSVNTGKAGKYELTYTATDKAGNTATVKRMITVEVHVKATMPMTGSMGGIAWGGGFATAPARWTRVRCMEAHHAALIKLIPFLKSRIGLRDRHNTVVVSQAGSTLF